MRAAAIREYGDAGVFRLEDLPVPVPGDHQVLVRVHASSVNPVDWKMRRGDHRLYLRKKFPIVPGYDIAGVIVKTGASVDSFKSGDEVFARIDHVFGGAYAEYAVTGEDTLALKPDNISFHEASAVPLAGITALQALKDKGHTGKGMKVLIIGAAGGVGHFAVQLASLLGGEVTAVSSHRHEDFIKEMDPAYYIDYTKHDFKQMPDLYDIIFDVAGVESFLSCKNKLKKRGVYITTLPRPKLIIHKIFSWLTGGKRVKTLLMQSRGSDLEYLASLIAENRIKIKIDRIFPLEKIAEAHRYCEAYRTEGKVVIDIP